MKKEKRLTVALAADHGGFSLKNELLERLRGQFDILDLGAHTYNPDDDYPDFAEAIAKTIISGKAKRGILVCGSGVGASIAANKFPGIKAALCHDTYSAHQGVEHDNMNVLCLGGRVIGLELAAELSLAFLNANFSGLERYRRRLDKIASFEKIN